MKKLLTVVLSIMILCSVAIAQNANSSTTQGSSTNANATKRKPPFRATSDQIKQAQALLKERGFYSGDQTGKLDPDTRSGLKKYQEAEKIKVTGTLNKLTLQKMGIALTDRQKAI